MAPTRRRSTRSSRSRTPSLMVTFKFINKYGKFQELARRLDTMSAHITQGAFQGTRSRNSESSEAEPLTLATPPPQDEGGKVPISRSANAPIKSKLPSTHVPAAFSPRSILKKSSSPTKKNVYFKLENDFCPTPSRSASSPSPESPSTVNSLRDSGRREDMSQENRPKLKLSFSKLNVNRDQTSPSAPSATPSTAATPSLKLKLKQPAPTPGLAPPTTPASAIAKEKKKKESGGGGSSSKKRKKAHDEADESSADDLSLEKSQKKQVKKIRFVQKPQDGQPKSATTPQTPFIKLKHKGKVAKRPLGVGYDSELSDRESDPTISDAFIFRMPPGPDCDLLQKAVENGLIGARKVEGGPDIQMLFHERYGRRAQLNIEGRIYAATVVDLPCIVEGMKSWDKKGWIKSADISQMFLVLGRAENEEEVKNYPLPPEVDPKTFQYAHGVTPPMQWVRKRRFARTKRTSLSAIEAVERKVNQLLADDATAESVKWDVIDYDSYTREEYERERSLRQSYDESVDGYDEDAEGEEEEDDYFGQENGAAEMAVGDEGGDIDEDEVAAELEAHLMASDEDEEPHDSSMISINGGAPITNVNRHIAAATTSTSASPSVPTASATAAASTPAAQTTTTATTSDAEEEPATAAATSPSSSEDEDEDDDDEEDDTNLRDSDDADADADISDEEALAARRELREKIAELADSIKEEEEKFRVMQNPIIRKKIQNQIVRLRADLAMARREAGMGDDDDDEEGDGADGTAANQE